VGLPRQRRFEDDAESVYAGAWPLIASSGLCGRQHCETVPRAQSYRVGADNAVTSRGTATGALATSLTKRAPRYASLGFPDRAASTTGPVRMQPGKSLTRPIANALLPGTRVSRALKLNRCSTTRASTTGKRSQPLPAPTAS
jgi:hypothetical protein